MKPATPSNERFRSTNDWKLETCTVCDERFSDVRAKKERLT